MSKYLDGLADEVARARAHLTWVAAGSKGQQVPFHGDLAGAPLSVLKRLDWWIREMRGEEAAAQAREAKLREVLEYVGGPPEDWGDRVVGECADSYKRGWREAWLGLGADARKVLALPAGRTALDALLAEARHEGAKACVEAAQVAHGRAFSGSPDSNVVLQAVRAAAAELATKEPT